MRQTEGRTGCIWQSRSIRQNKGRRKGGRTLDPQGGKEPVWNKDFEFDIVTEQELELEVLDKEIIGEDMLMGRTKVSILDWIVQGKYSGKIDLLDDSRKLAGYLKLSANFFGPGAVPSSPEPSAPSGDPALNSSSTFVSAEAPSSSSSLSFASSPQGSKGRDLDGNFSDDEILGASRGFDLDKNNYVGAAALGTS